MHTNDKKDDWNYSSNIQTVPDVPLVRQLPPPNLEIRLQQAAHILVNGAIRAAMKQRAVDAQKEAPTTPKVTTGLRPEQMSDIQTSADFCLEAKGKSVSRSGKKPSQMPRPAKVYGRKPNGSKDFGIEGALLGNMS